VILFFVLEKRAQLLFWPIDQINSLQKKKKKKKKKRKVKRTSIQKEPRSHSVGRCVWLLAKEEDKRSWFEKAKMEQEQIKWVQLPARYCL